MDSFKTLYFLSLCSTLRCCLNGSSQTIFFCSIPRKSGLKISIVFICTLSKQGVSCPALPCCSSLLEAFQQVQAEPQGIFTATPRKITWCTDRSPRPSPAWFTSCIQPLLQEGKQWPREPNSPSTQWHLFQSLTCKNELVPLTIHCIMLTKSSCWDSVLEIRDPPPGRHLNQAWGFWWACNSVIQLLIKNDCTPFSSYRKGGWCCLLQLYL